MNDTVKQLVPKEIKQELYNSLKRLISEKNNTDFPYVQESVVDLLIGNDVVVTVSLKLEDVRFIEDRLHYEKQTPSKGFSNQLNTDS